MRGFLTAVAAFIAAFVSPASAQVTTQDEADAFYAELYRQSDVRIDIAGGQAQLNVSSAFDFIGANDTRRLLLDAFGSPPELVEGVEGAFTAANENPLYGGWVAVVTFHPIGHVLANDGSLDPYTLLNVIGNFRGERNAEIQIVDWSEPPHYDAEAHTLIWPFETKTWAGYTWTWGFISTSSDGSLFEYRMSLLGRDGALTINVLSQDLDVARSVAPMLLATSSFNVGFRYDDYQAGDPVAHSQFAALVTGQANAPDDEPFELQYEYEMVPAEPAAAEPPPAWAGPAVWSLLAALALLFIFLIVLSNRGNVAVRRASRDYIRGVSTVDLDRVVRVRESLRVVRAYFGQTLLSLGGFLYVALVGGGLGMVLYYVSAPNSPEQSPLMLLSWLLGLNILALFGLVFLSLFQYIHRRFVAAFQVVMTPVVLLTSIGTIAQAGEPLGRGVSALFGQDSATTTAIMMLVVFGLMIASMVIVFGWARNCWRVMVARRDNFLVARGWRAPGYTLGGAVRRMLGVPTYVSALRNGRKRVMMTFVLAGALCAGAALFPFVAPGLIANLLAAGASPGSPDADAQFAMWMVIGTPIFVVTFFLLLQLLAYFGRMASRKGERSAADRYQSVREWDAREPILFLRSFAIDNRPVAARPRGLTARLIGLGARFPTLDEAVLDCAAPYGPIIAIGDPRDPVPPLGAARTFVGGDDWRQVVSDLARASRLILLAVDSSEGVRWEVQHIIAQGHAGKTLFLASPERPPEERAASLCDVARALGYDVPLPDQAIALSSAPGGIEVMLAPNASSDSYAAAINLRLQQDFGLAVNFPRRPTM